MDVEVKLHSKYPMYVGKGWMVTEVIFMEPIALITFAKDGSKCRSRLDLGKRVFIDLVPVKLIQKAIYRIITKDIKGA